jgi:hypothetical protein
MGKPPRESTPRKKARPPSATKAPARRTRKRSADAPPPGNTAAGEAAEIAARSEPVAPEAFQQAAQPLRRGGRGSRDGREAAIGLTNPQQVGVTAEFIAGPGAQESVLTGEGTLSVTAAATSAANAVLDGTGVLSGASEANANGTLVARATLSDSLKATDSFNAVLVDNRAEAVAAVDAVATSLEQITATLSTLRNLAVVPGDNRASERNEAITGITAFIRLGTATVLVVREQAVSPSPSKAVIEQNATAFEAVATGAKSYCNRLAGYLAGGAALELGKLAVDHYHAPIDKLLSQLDTQIANLSHHLPNLIDALHHWAALIPALS